MAGWSRIVATTRVVAAMWGISSAAIAQGNAGGDGRVDSVGVRYARYAPFACAAISLRDEQQFWRDRRPDTVAAPPLGNPLQANTVVDVGRCVARYTIDGVPTAALLGLGRAYLDANEDRLADSAFRRLIRDGTERSVDERAWDLYMVIMSYMSAAPVRLTSALEYLRQLDAMGSPAAAGRLLAHELLFGQAVRMDSVPFMDSESDAAVRASRDLRGDARYEWAWQSAAAYSSRADVAGRQGDSQQAIATLRAAAAELGPFRKGIQLSLLGGTLPYTRYGTTATSLQSTFAYGPGSSTRAADLELPAHGHVSLLVFVDKNCSALCYPGYSVIRRLVARYAGAGLDVTLVTRTSGWDRNRLVMPTDEGDLIRDFYHGYVNIPAPIVVWKTEFARKPDGGRRIVSMPNDTAYAGAGRAAPSLQTVLIDRAGVIRQIVVASPRMEQRLNGMIAELLR